MPYDASLPVNGSKVKAAELRGQFAGLKELIDAVPAGPPGQGFVFRGAWDGTSSYMPYDVATHAGSVYVAVAVVSPTPTEPQDLPTHWQLFAQRGTDGGQGGQGEQGIQGAPGEVTNAAMADAIATAIAGTSNNTNAIPTLDTPYADPGTEE